MCARLSAISIILVYPIEKPAGRFFLIIFIGQMRKLGLRNVKTSPKFTQSMLPGLAFQLRVVGFQNPYSWPLI